MDLTKFSSDIGKIKVKNVVDMPLFYALWVLLLAVVTAIAKTENWITIILFCFAGVLFLIAVFGYLYFSVKSPDYLRSEEYHLKKQSLEILGDNDNLLPIDAKNIVEVTKPRLLQNFETKASNNDD